MIFSTVFASLTLAASVLAAPNLAARAAPSVTYPRAGTVWAPNYRHNVTWVPQSGTGTIALKPSSGNAATLANNVDLSSGRIEITVPANLQPAANFAVTITTGGETSSSQQFGVGPVDTAPPPASASASASSAVSSATSIASSVASSASSAVSSASSVASSVASSASSAASSVSSAASSASSSLESATSSIGQSASSAASSLSASLSSAISSLSSAAQSGASSISSQASSAASSASSAASSNGNAAIHTADLGITRFGVAIGAGLVAIATFGGALIF